MYFKLCYVFEGNPYMGITQMLNKWHLLSLLKLLLLLHRCFALLRRVSDKTGGELVSSSSAHSQSKCLTFIKMILTFLSNV